MIDLNDFIVKVTDRKDRPGEINRRKLYKCKCDKCDIDRGYLRKDAADLCKDCARADKKVKPSNIKHLTCIGCDIDFSTTQYNKKFCSKRCKQSSDRNKRRSTDQGKLRHRVSSLMSTRLRLQGLNKNNKSTFNILPYTLEELMLHLESQFEDWMSWDNYGLQGWTIDHIVPESHFDYSSTEDSEFKRCWDLSNLRPVRHGGPNGNAAKGNKLLADIM